ncbi:MAG: SMP-30/gluconolactonase/LRE family protein [Nitrospira sp.]|nr:SMP-30/gluconolactonase/LRE family protein [bacterium]MBL7050408.1 SMP-30/gluconolactonase/LRE family protein [Nitrospira sp.]
MNFRTCLLLAACCFSLILIGCAAAPPKEEPVEEIVWPSPPDDPRIKWITQWADKHDFEGPDPFLTFFLGEDPVESLQRPNTVIADAAGNVYVADTEQGLIFVFDVEQNGLRFLGNGVLAGPVGLAIDNKRGIIFVADSRLNKVFGLDKKTGDIILTIGTPGDFQHPSGMVFNEDRDILYVTDTQNHRIRVFDKDGIAIYNIGERGYKGGEFNFPSFLALDMEGRLYVADTLNFRIQIFDQEGYYIKEFGKLGDASGTFTRPYGVGVDSDGHVYVIDSAFNNFQIFNDDGTLLLFVGTPGAKPGEFYLPTGLYIDKNDKIYVADTFNRRVQIFQYLKEQGAVDRVQEKIPDN